MNNFFVRLSIVMITTWFINFEERLITHFKNFDEEEDKLFNASLIWSNL